MNYSLPSLSVALLAAGLSLNAQTTITDSLTFTGAMQVYTVPCGVTSITIDAYGAQGGAGATGGNNSTGGFGANGGYASGTLSVVPGQTLFIYVGGAGATPTAGFNGGANAGSQNAGGGGGATDVRVNSLAVADRVLVAGGGGGGGRGGCESAIVNGGNGGLGGGGNGANGADAPTPSGFAGGGRGAVGATFGAAGIGCSGFLGQPGVTATTEIGGGGGNGQTCCCFSAGSIPGGGGGGGGFIGGGGGGGGSAGTTGCSGNDKGGGGGGAGGSSYTGGVNAGVTTNGVRAGNGAVYITYNDPTPNALTLISNITSACIGSSLTISVNPDVNSTSYNWAATGGVTITAGQGTNTVTVTIAGNGSLDVNGVNTCATGPVFNIPITAVALPTIAASSTLQIVCEGNTTSLSATGGDTYVWSNGDTTATTFVTPVTTTTYTVTGTNTVTGCSDTASTTITVFPLPVITTSSNPQTICAGSTAQIFATGADIYLWSTGDTTSSVVVVPNVTTTYTVTGTNTLTACNNVSSVTVTVNPLPTVTLTLASAQACVNDGVMTLSGGSPAGGTFTGTAVTGTSFNPATAGVGTHVITYTFVDANGCTNFATQNIVVSPCVGITEASTLGMTLMPNPATTQLNLTWQVALTSIEIMDAAGRVVFTQSVSNRNSLTVDLLELPAGVYSVRYSNNNTVTAQQTFVKQ